MKQYCDHTPMKPVLDCCGFSSLLAHNFFESYFNTSTEDFSASVGKEGQPASREMDFN